MSSHAEAAPRAADEKGAAAAEARLAMRQANLAANEHPPDGSNLRGLESNTKKATALVRRVRALSEETRQPLLDELHRLNLRLYVSEVAAAIAEAKLRSSDVVAALEIASAMHRAYADFRDELVPLVHKQASVAAPSSESEAERAARLARKRMSLRLLGELYCAGVCTDFAPVLTAIKDVAKQDADAAKSAANAAEPSALLVPNLPAISGFVRHVCPALLGARPRPAADVENGDGSASGAEAAGLLPEPSAKQLTGLLSSYYKLVSRQLVSEHARLQRAEKANRCAGATPLQTHTHASARARARRADTC